MLVVRFLLSTLNEGLGSVLFRSVALGNPPFSLRSLLAVVHSDSFLCKDCFASELDFDSASKRAVEINHKLSS